jgi:hypothetical protein
LALIPINKEEPTPNGKKIPSGQVAQPLGDDLCRIYFLAAAAATKFGKKQSVQWLLSARRRRPSFAFAVCYLF